MQNLRLTIGIKIKNGGTIMKCPKCGTESEAKFCENCGSPMSEADVSSQNAPQQNVAAAPVKAKKKPIYKKWWFWVIIAVVAIGIIGNLGGNNDSPSKENGTSSIVSSVNNDKPEVTVADFSAMDKAAIQNWADTNKVTCKFEEAYSDSIASGSFVSQSANANKVIHEGDTIKIVFSLGKEPTVEYKNALRKAETYSKTMHMSKKALYDQLTSEYGEKFPADAAQYAIDNIQADWNANALEKAKTYQKSMSMSKSAIYDQLISDYGEKFTKEEAQYAIDHLDD